MSAQGSTDKSPRSEGRKTNNRRRRPQSGTRRRPSNSNNANTSPNTAPAKTEGGEITRRPRAEPVPVPENLFGKREIGTVISVIRKGRYNFGFIVLGKDPKPEDNQPKIYFNPSHVAEPKLFLRRGFIVEFTIERDEEGRSVAKDIQLTEEGVARKAEADEAAAKRRAERQDQQQKTEAEGTQDQNEERKTRPRQKRRTPRPEGKKINLRVTVDGKDGEKTIEFDTNQTIGKLKNLAVTAAEAPVEYVVFHKGAFLTKAAFSALQDNDVVHLTKPQEEAK